MREDMAARGQRRRAALRIADEMDRLEPAPIRAWPQAEPFELRGDVARRDLVAARAGFARCCAGASMVTDGSAVAAPDCAIAAGVAQVASVTNATPDAPRPARVEVRNMGCFLMPDTLPA